MIDGYGGHAQYLDGAPAPQLDAHLEDGVVVGGLYDVHEVVGAEDGVLLHNLDAEGLDLLVDLLDALRLALQSLLSLGCQRG